MTAAERVEEAAHLISVPEVAALKLGQGHVAAVDMVENHRDFHAGHIPFSRVFTLICFFCFPSCD